MTENLKCPFCKQELAAGGIVGTFGCPKCRNFGTVQLWQEIDRTNKLLVLQEKLCNEYENYLAYWKNKCKDLENELAGNNNV